MPRRVHVVVCDAAGTLLGELPPYDVDSAWWPDVEPVAAGARDLHGADVDVLRLLAADGDPPAGGTVTYLAELRGGTAALIPTAATTDEQPLRAPWARPGGVQDLVTWADRALATHGRARTGPARQVRSWNLSAVLALPTDDGPVWVKAAPPFMSHEGAAIALVAAVAPTAVPPLLAHEPGRVLLGDVPGEDQWQPPPERLDAMAERLVGMQAALAGRTDDLLAAGLPDWRAARFPDLAATLVARADVRAAVGPDDLAVLDPLVARLPERFAALAECGVPETLVHGDFHFGNWRSDGASLVLMDWGDSGVGHPLFDLAVAPELRSAACAAWRAAVEGSDPERAAGLIAPVAALRQALIYRTFLDGIEPAERPYHDGDVPQWLCTAARAAASSWG